MMHRKPSLSCGLAWLVLLFFSLDCPAAQRGLKCLHDKRARVNQRPHSAKKFCNPAFNQSAGAITQKCLSGFYRERTGPYKGQCLPCRCNGLSNECDKHTGTCMNCQFNTTGERCQRCKEGCYGNATNRTCRACPCPHTWNNFAAACMDIGPDVVECLCKRGYSGSRCERCAHGYYGNPSLQGGSCEPCKWGNGISNTCDPFSRGCDSCTYALLVDSEIMEEGLTLRKRQMWNISLGTGSHSVLNILKANVSGTKILVGRYNTAVLQLDPKVEQLETAVHVVRGELSQLLNETLQSNSDLDKVSQSVNGTKLKADNLPETESLQTAIQDLIKRLSEGKPGGSIALSEEVGLMDEAQRLVQEMRERGCTAQRDEADNEQEEGNKLWTSITDNGTVPVETDEAAASLMASGSFLRELSELLSEAEDRVNRSQDLNLKSHNILQHLQMERNQSMLSPLVELTKDLLKNITHIFSPLDNAQKEIGNHAAQLDGARGKLLQKMNEVFEMTTKADMVTRAEESAAQIHSVASQFHQLLHKATNSNELLGVLGNSIINALEEAEVAAHQSRQAAKQALREVQEGSQVNWAEELQNNSTHLQTQAKTTQNDLKKCSHTANNHEDRVRKQKEKGELLKRVISAVSDDLKEIRGEDTKVLIESAKTAASASKSTVRIATKRLRNIRQKVESITLPNASGNMDHVLTNVEQALNNLKTALPAMTNKLKRVETLKEKTPADANMTKSIRRIKDVIEETRNVVNRLSIATTFNGKGHVELHPPRNLEDTRPFTAVDLLLNRHQNTPTKTERRRRKPRRDKRSDANLFVLYLGNKDASGDFIGMAVRNDVLVCVYKLGGVVHEVATSPISTTISVNSSHFDRVVFHRVYQDAEVNVMKNFTSREPVILSPFHNLPDTAAGVLNLQPDRVAFYVGGYPDDFTPPLELRYSGYKGAMKLSYLNDNPVCLFNYKHAANMDPKQPYIKTPKSEVSDYYDGTGYRMAFIKEPHEKKRRLFRFHTNSRETDALLFYIGNEDSFFCVFVDRGFLVIQGRLAGRELRSQSAEILSLVDQVFEIVAADRFIVLYGTKQISTDHTHTNYLSYYVGGLPAPLRLRHNITAPPLRGCVDHMTEGSGIVEYNRTIGVRDGCPVSLLGVRTATLHSALSMDSLFVRDEEPVRVSLGFRTTDAHGALLRSSSQGNASLYDLQLSLHDGYVVFNSTNYTLRSDERCSDGRWHYVSAVRRPTGLELSIDNVIVAQGQSNHMGPVDQNSRGRKFECCIANFYTRRPGRGFIPADLSSFSQTGHVVPGQCGLHRTPHKGPLPTPVQKQHQKHKLIQAPAGSQCGPPQGHRGEYQFYDVRSWLSYTLPQQDLNYRPHFSLEVKTNSSKGLILHVTGRGVVPLLAIYVTNGKIKMSLGQNRIIQNKQRSNDGNWHRVELSVEKSTFHLLVDGVRVTDGHLPDNEGSFLNLSNPVYLGGDLTRRTIQGHDIPMTSIFGCVRNFKINNVAVGEPEASHKTSTCSHGLTEMGKYFGGGHIILDIVFTIGSLFELSFELRPQYLTGLLFHAQSDEANLSVFLMETKVVVKLNNSSVSVSVTPGKSLCDGNFHMVSVSKKHNVIKLTMDSMSKEKAFSFPPLSHAMSSLSIGGTTKDSGVPVSSPYVGYMRNVTINRRPVAIGPVTVNQCP